MSNWARKRGTATDPNRRARRSLYLLAVLLASACGAGCASAPTTEALRQQQVLFVCEHGNVKSLMAASYFNREATQRGLAVRALSRGAAPDSTSVPAAIVEGLGRDGFDVSRFAPSKVTRADVDASWRVILISAELPAALPTGDATVERWTDVPAASVSFGDARASLREHVRRLIDDLAKGSPP